MRARVALAALLLSLAGVGTASAAPVPTVAPVAVYPVDSHGWTTTAPRLFGTGELEEDESPWRGAYGGELISYGDGIACYADHTASTGDRWRIVQTCERDR
ncbi:hypothetical protein QLT00_gp93 [Gordonia phage Commandaria]|uniref:Uncharacterized protein n=1 Tax=Gordonia phage Commandaria TaxID=3038364 RepID=A0AAF0K7G8_9CAUD|nr:hypothetical protein QLT00_gp93 [Gordonia phage Commandaria]WGH20876.1 hypothetical protein [Gordonia phage Commandaria]